jgi:hypothetical protein
MVPILNWRMASKAIGLLALLAGLFGAHLLDKHYAVKAALENAALVAENKQSQIETQLLVQHFQRLEEKDATIDQITARLNAANRSLHNRPSRSDSQTSCTPGPITGAQLPREDGEFLTGEAARAQRILVERNYYYEEYEKVRKALENGKQE